MESTLSHRVLGVNKTGKSWRRPAGRGYARPMETLIKKLVNAKSGEGKALFWSFAYFFFLMSTYYMLLPLRDAFGIRGGAQDLPWLFLGTFVVSLITAPLQASIAARLPRQRFVPVTYLFLVANILVFWFLLKSEVAPGVVAKAFFIWITVFSVFTVSIFWTFMSDLYSSEQGKRLFGFIAAGGSLGTILGPILNKQLVGPIGVANLLLVASALLIGAVLCANRLEPAAAELAAANPEFVAASAGREKKPVGGGDVRRLRPGVQVALPAQHRAVGIPAVAAGHFPVSHAGAYRGVVHRRHEGAHEDLLGYRQVGGHPVAGRAAAGHGTHHQEDRHRQVAGHPAGGVRDGIRVADVHFRAVRGGRIPGLPACGQFRHRQCGARIAVAGGEP